MNQVIHITKRFIRAVRDYQRWRQCAKCEKDYELVAGTAIIQTPPSAYAGTLYFCKECTNNTDLEHFVY